MIKGIDEVRRRSNQAMAGYPGSWWIAGGWAIDGWLGTVTRDHHDLDLAVLRKDLDQLWRHLRGWTVWINEPGRFLPWDGGPLGENDACFMARPDDGLVLEWAEFAEHPANIEFMIEDSADDVWLYRRDRRVRDKLDRLGPSSSFLAPEIALLYKATEASEESNRADLHSALPELGVDRQKWLADALSRAHAGHPWIAELTP